MTLGLAGSTGFGPAQIVRPATTGSDGRFSFDDMGPGAYVISGVHAPGYVVNSGILDDNVETDGTSVSDEPRYVRPGDSVEIKLTKGAVITGRVSDVTGTPLAGVPVRATRIRGEDGRRVYSLGPETMYLAGQGWKTDDRGIYRIFGLEAGVYLVSAGSSSFSFGTGAYDRDAPTYYPGSERAGASEVTARKGEEVTGIDITYQNLSGHAVGGSVNSEGAATAAVGVVVVLTDAVTGVIQGIAVGVGNPSGRPYRLLGVPDGSYHISAFAAADEKNLSFSAPRTVHVNGVDVTGIDLVLRPPAELSGRVVVENASGSTSRDAKQNCPKAPTSPLRQVVVVAIPPTDQVASTPRGLWSPAQNVGIPSDAGEFTLKLLDDGVYHLNTRLPGDDLYLRSITAPPIGDAKQPQDASAGIDVKMATKIGGIVITLSPGAARLSGRVVAKSNDGRPPLALKVVLVPAEPDAATNLLRYKEVKVAADGGFAFRNLAPGRYFIMPRRVHGKEWNEVAPVPLWWNPVTRAKLIEEARKTKTMLDLTPCNDLKDYVVNYSPKPTMPQVPSIPASTGKRTRSL